MALGRNIRILRKFRGLSQIDLAQKAGIVDHRSISALEVRDSIRSQFSLQIAKALDVPPELLQETEDEVRAWITSFIHSKEKSSESCFDCTLLPDQVNNSSISMSFQVALETIRSGAESMQTDLREVFAKLVSYYLIAPSGSKDFIKEVILTLSRKAERNSRD